MNNVEEFVDLINKAEAQYNNSTKENRINILTSQMLLISYLKHHAIDLNYNLDRMQYEIADEKISNEKEIV